MFRVNKLFRGTVNLKDHNAQVNEIYVIIETAHKDKYA